MYARLCCCCCLGCSLRFNDLLTIELSKVCTTWMVIILLGASCTYISNGMTDEVIIPGPCLS